MRIDSIRLCNFRQHQDTFIEFPKAQEFDIHIMVGRNGSGKTNLLSAINWCFYGKETSVSEESEKLPLVNVISLKEANDKTRLDVAVIIIVSNEDGEKIEFKRSQKFFAEHKAAKPIPGDQEFTVTAFIRGHNDQVLKGERATQKVRNFVPERIREFFFFDGERLDTYFMNATGTKIRQAVKDISQLDLLETLERRLDEIHREMRRASSDHNPKIKELNDKLIMREQIIEALQAGIRKSNSQIENAEEQLEVLEKKLRDMPDVAVLENEREKRVQQKKNKEALRDNKIVEKDSILIEYARLLFLRKAIDSSLDLIKGKRETKELPPPIDTKLLQDIINEQICYICGRPLDEACKNYVCNLGENIKQTSFIGQQLMVIENPLHRLRDKSGEFDKKNSEITIVIAEYEQEITAHEKRINAIDQELASFSLEEVRSLQKQRKDFETIRNQQREKLGGQKRDLQSAILGKEDLEKKHKLELDKQEKEKKRVQAISFCKRAHDIVVSTNASIMEQIRSKIEERTKEFFFDLVWKKETFKNVTIDKQFKLHLVDRFEFECLGSISAAERELMALSFTLALHLVSGFDSPLVVDTPLSRVSDDNRANFARVLKEVSRQKQIILLFTFDEYSDEVQSHLETISASRLGLEVLPGERITKIGGIYNA